MGYSHISIKERELIYLLLEENLSYAAIGKILGRSKSTISREIKRNTGSDNYYSPSEATQKYKERRKNSHAKYRLDDQRLFRFIKNKIFNQQWSPEQIANRLKLEGNALSVSYATIYRGFRAGRFDYKTPTSIRKGSRKLRHRGRKMHYGHTKDNRGCFPVSNDIESRPLSAQTRSRFGHWEADTVIGKRGKKCLLTLNDRKSRFLIARKAERKNAKCINRQMIKALSGVTVKSITPDRGKEFAGHSEVTEALGGVQFYFPGPHQPWQRGTNENSNGLLREYFPKGEDIGNYSSAQIKSAVNKLNKRPRKCLDWKTPYEVFYRVSLHLT